jgi:hypothetical protein
MFVTEIKQTPEAELYSYVVLGYVEHFDKNMKLIKK